MFILFPIVASLLLIVVTYFIHLYLVLWNARKKCNWIPAAPRVPILGSILEFGSNSETLNDVGRLTNNPSKLSYMEILSSWTVIVKDYNLMEFILTSNVVLNKSREYEFFNDWLGTGLLTAAGPKWKKRRRIITPAFHFSILEQFVEIFESNGKILLRKLYDEAVDKESIDIYKYVTACALDIISDQELVEIPNEPEEGHESQIIEKLQNSSFLNLTIGSSNFNEIEYQIIEESCATDEALIPESSLLEFQNNVWDDSNRQELMSHEKNQESAMGVNVNTQQNKNQDYVFAVKEMCRLIMNRTFSSWKRVDFLYWFTSDYAKQQKYLKTLHDFTNSVISERTQELQKQKPNEKELRDDLGRKRKLAFLDLLLNSTVDGQPLTQEDIREEVDTFMFEGHDTTSSGIASTLFMLANHQDAQNQAREEQKKIFGKDRDAPTSYQDLQDMKYLELVIKEALRLIPPVPIINRTLHQDVQYKGHTIPKDTIINLYIYGINRDPDFHESPEEFKPERFLNNGKQPFSYVPFSAGPRNCIGQKFAVLEMKSIISKILRHFELSPTNPPHKLELVNEAVLKSANGVKIRLKKHNWSE